MKFIRAFSETWAPILFFAALLGFVGLGISHVDAKVRAEEERALEDAASTCSSKLQIDQDPSEDCFQATAEQLDHIEYGSLRSLFVNWR
ncbi:hypothetical protein [Telmatospirillum sp.]|uniref:hypothetical protein n=1 Tax=Telmatospirillum sp. TaxID=2079197 RepID=UPI00284D69F7|nr:hypothetical protein [Telmatospirillum sp.]MDR3436109.1 hypothetical protein [Telmatospirillum sp.]